jgi:hypothetical protein
MSQAFVGSNPACFMASPTFTCEAVKSSRIGAAAFLAAAAQAFPQATAELVYLADMQAQPISLTPRKLDSRKDTIGRHLQAIRGGRFPAKASSFTCPNCPALFVCGPVPSGQLKPEMRHASKANS